MGKSSIFIRFRGCNLRCKWCDTKYSSFPEHYNGKNFTLEDAITFIKKNKQISNIIFTGGEPLLFQEQIFEIMMNFKNKSFEIETNGTIEIKEKILNFNPLLNISPKPAHSQLKEHMKRIKKIEYRLLEQVKLLNYKNYIVKFVIKDRQDLIFAESLIKKYKMDKNNVYLQPNCQSKEECIKRGKEIIKICLKKGYNYSSRLQFLIGIK